MKTLFLCLALLCAVSETNLTAQQSPQKAPAQTSVPAAFLANYRLSPENEARLRSESGLKWLNDALSAQDFATKNRSLPPFRAKYWDDPTLKGTKLYRLSAFFGDLIYDFIYTAQEIDLYRKNDRQTPEPTSKNILHLLCSWRWRLSGNHRFVGFNTEELKSPKWSSGSPYWPSGVALPPRDIRRYAIAKALVDGADPNQKDSFGNSPQIFADEDAAKIFIDANVDSPELLLVGIRSSFSANTLAALLKKHSPNLADDEKNSLLHLAVSGRNPVATRLLLNAGANPNTVNAKGLTPLHTLLPPPPQGDDISGFEILKQLVQGNADINATVPASGKTALHVAAEKGHPVYLALLLYLGADPYMKDNSGATPEDLLHKLLKRNPSQDAKLTQRLLNEWKLNRKIFVKNFISSKIALPELNENASARSEQTPKPTTGTTLTWEMLFPQGIVKIGSPIKTASYTPLKKLRGDCVLLFRKDPQAFNDFFSNHKKELILIFDPTGYDRVKNNRELTKKLKFYKVQGYHLPIGATGPFNHLPGNAAESDCVLLDENLNVVFSGKLSGRTHSLERSNTLAELEKALEAFQENHNR